MASLEFQDYVLIWWEQVIEQRQTRGEPPITTWTEMKDVMRARFVPTHYTHDLFKKLQLLKQDTKTVEEYYQEMEIAMIRANVKEDDEQTMARFLNGLNHCSDPTRMDQVSVLKCHPWIGILTHTVLEDL